MEAPQIHNGRVKSRSCFYISGMSPCPDRDYHSVYSKWMGSVRRRIFCGDGQHPVPDERHRVIRARVSVRYCLWPRRTLIRTLYSPDVSSTHAENASQLLMSQVVLFILFSLRLLLYRTCQHSYYGAAVIGNELKKLRNLCRQTQKTKGCQILQGLSKPQSTKSKKFVFHGRGI